jgi:hypothetical protein
MPGFMNRGGSGTRGGAASPAPDGPAGYREELFGAPQELSDAQRWWQENQAKMRGWGRDRRGIPYGMGRAGAGSMGARRRGGYRGGGGGEMDGALDLLELMREQESGGGGGGMGRSPIRGGFGYGRGY